jgi:gamma-D-glutamyl-L-lysine dipeptidyl-peptidase
MPAKPKTVSLKKNTIIPTMPIASVLVQHAESSLDIPAIVNVSVANVYSAPNHRSELTTQAWLGIVVTINAEQKEWRHITMPDGYTGWTHKANLVPAESKALRAWTKEERVIITSHIDFVYSAMDMNSPRVCDVVQSNVVRVIAEIRAEIRNTEKKSKQITNADWWHVALPDGRTGYVRYHAAQELHTWLKSRSHKPADIIATAKQYIGIPYTWGGTSPKTMDCSGYMRVVFAQHGLFFQRDASQQARQGIPVTIATTATAKHEDFSQIQVGDLLFFGDRITPKEYKITHVGLYMGDGEYIHAAGLVKINSLIATDTHFDEERYTTLVSARRFLGATQEQGIRSMKNLYK